MASEFIAELLKIPPVTRFLCATQLAVTLPVMLQLVSPARVVLIWKLVTKRYEESPRPIDIMGGGTEFRFTPDMEDLHEFLPWR
jgi:hypothetical protein